MLATRFGLAAADAAAAGAWGQMPGLRGNDIVLCALADAVKDLRTVPLAEYRSYGSLIG